LKNELNNIKPKLINNVLALYIAHKQRKFIMKHLFSLILFISLITISCKTENKEMKENSKADSPEMKYTLTPFENSASFPDATLAGMDYMDGKFNFDVQGSSYTLGEQTSDAPQKMCANSAEGQHIHLIVDNEPYAAKYTSEFDYDITDGEHYLLAFLSRSYHESIKTADASIAVKAKVENKTIQDIEPIEDAMVFYSRPKGTYVGEDTKKVMLDFYLKNVRLGDQYKLEADINGEKHIITDWQPYYIEGLPMGENTISLSLMNMEGTVVDSPLNPVTRTFELKANPNPVEQ
jgi:hypothetical protein